jgi:mRNA interferase MazF
MNNEIISQGDIWLIDFNPTIGDEIKKIRPAVVLNGDFATGLDLKIVAPVTTWRNDFEKIWWLYKLKPTMQTGLKEDSSANCYQMRCVSVSRFLKKLGSCGKDIVEIVATAQNCLEIV